MTVRIPTSKVYSTPTIKEVDGLITMDFTLTMKERSSKLLGADYDCLLVWTSLVKLAWGVEEGLCCKLGEVAGERTSALRGLRTSSIFFPDLAAATKARLNAISSSVAPLIGPCRQSTNHALYLICQIWYRHDWSSSWQTCRRAKKIRSTAILPFSCCKTNISYGDDTSLSRNLCHLHCAPRWLSKNEDSNLRRLYPAAFFMVRKIAVFSIALRKYCLIKRTVEDWLTLKYFTWSSC